MKTSVVSFFDMDLIMFEERYKYCPSCLDEYRPEINVCAACQAELVTGEEMLARQQEEKARERGRAGELHGDDDLVSVRRGPLAEMKAYEKLLKSAQIGTLLAGDESSCGKGCCPGNFDLLVRREEARDALLIIEAEIKRTAVLDHEGGEGGDSVFDPLAAENTCPACGHCFSGGTECPDCGLCF